MSQHVKKKIEDAFNKMRERVDPAPAKDEDMVVVKQQRQVLSSTPRPLPSPEEVFGPTLAKACALYKNVKPMRVGEQEGIWVWTPKESADDLIEQCLNVVDKLTKERDRYDA